MYYVEQDDQICYIYNKYINNGNLYVRNDIFCYWITPHNRIEDAWYSEKQTSRPYTAFANRYVEKINGWAR